MGRKGRKFPIGLKRVPSVAQRPLPGLRKTADLVFRPTRVAVFVDGCYWHGCPQRYKEPKTNTGYWRAKIAGNGQRDRQTDELLSEAGWLVLRFREHEDPNEIADAIASAVEERRLGGRGGLLE